GKASLPTSALVPGTHVIRATYSGDGNFTSSLDTLTQTVGKATLSATGVNIKATAGAPFSGTVATFSNPIPSSSASSYTASIAWGDGSTSAGVISGSGSSLSVSGSHTYTDPVNRTVQVTISHKLGYTTSPTTSGTATVSSLGLAVQRGLTGMIGFWSNSSGQALISKFNGSSTSTALANWLAATFPNLYRASAGA